MSLSRESSEEVHIALGKQGDIFDDLIDLIAERNPDCYEQAALATYAPSRFMPEPGLKLPPDLRAWLQSFYGS